jgi:NAD(P)H-flavin reductase
MTTAKDNAFPTLKGKYLKARKAYYAGAPIMTDKAFDKLEKEKC